MKKLLTIFTMAFLLAVMGSFLAADTNAQTRRYASNRSGNYKVYKRPNVYKRHRKKFNVGIAAGAGMLMGGLLGGGKGVVVGGLAGAGAGALFSQVQKPKSRVRYVRRN